MTINDDIIWRFDADTTLLALYMLPPSRSSSQDFFCFECWYFRDINMLGHSPRIDIARERAPHKDFDFARYIMAFLAIRQCAPPSLRYRHILSRLGPAHFYRPGAVAASCFFNVYKNEILPPRSLSRNTDFLLLHIIFIIAFTYRILKIYLRWWYLGYFSDITAR